MKRRKLLKSLAGFLDQSERMKRKHRDELEALLEKLENKELELQEKAKLEKDERTRRRFNKEIEIIKAQREKGLQALRDMTSP